MEARLHVLFARAAPVAVVIRRGPSKSVCTIRWDRRRDIFEVGQWLRGRIYERRADLSPDGRHMIYFAMNGRWRDSSKGAWTAISRAPYLKALVMLPKGDCWHGGGLFTSNRAYWLNDGYGHAKLRDTKDVTRDTTFRPSAYFGGECPSVYYPRLVRDGWLLVERRELAKWKCVDVFEKSAGDWILRKLAHAEVDHPVGRGCYWDEHELYHLPSRRTLAFPDWEWAELDGSRVCWAADGKLFAGRLGKSGLERIEELFDTNPLRFEAIKAPY